MPAPEGFDVFVGDHMVALELQQFVRENGWKREDFTFLGREGKLYHFKLYDKQKVMLFKLRFCG